MRPALVGAICLVLVVVLYFAFRSIEDKGRSVVPVAPVPAAKAPSPRDGVKERPPEVAAGVAERLGQVESLTGATAPEVKANSKLSFANQTGEPALVKLVRDGGASSQSIEVALDASATIEVADGAYSIKVRIGLPGNYAYTQGQSFVVPPQSDVTVTLNKALSGGHDTTSIGEAEFGK